jgi:hypothetical protein
MHMLMSVVLATRAGRAVRARLMRLRTLYMLKTVPWRVQGVHNEWWSTCGALEKSGTVRCGVWRDVINHETTMAAYG